MLELEMGIITAPLAIVRLLRFQQIICGYLPKSDDDNTLHDIPGGNPRLDLLAEICNDLPHKTIIWARFRRDIQLISQHKSIKNRCEIADGSVTGPARSEALDRFQKRDVQFLVANPAAIGIGVTLHAAQTVIYYNNSFKLSERLQSEDRAHRIGLLHPVHYIDLVAAGTVDIRIIESLQRKVNLAAQITGDTLRDWI
jgi:SNF2 family DNA or RNA helicase